MDYIDLEPLIMQEVNLEQMRCLAKETDLHVSYGLQLLFNATPAQHAIRSELKEIFEVLSSTVEGAEHGILAPPQPSTEELTLLQQYHLPGVDCAEIIKQCMEEDYERVFSDAALHH
jgi:hypothetical protein